MSRDSIVDEPTTVVFNLTCPEPRAWVVLSRAGTVPRVVEMWQPRPGYWSACAVVGPGEYRCRCYAGSSRTVTYYGPPEVDGGTECGMDVAFAIGGSTALDPQPLSPDGRSEMAHA